MVKHTLNKTEPAEPAEPSEPAEPLRISLKRPEGSISDLCFFLFMLCVSLVAFFVLIYDVSRWRGPSISWDYVGLLCLFAVLVFFFLSLIIQSCFVEVIMTEKYLININRLTHRTKMIRLDHIISYQVFRYHRRQICFIKLSDINHRSHRFIYNPKALDPYFLPKMQRQGARDVRRDVSKGRSLDA
jgi:hypothetical protein